MVVPGDIVHHDGLERVVVDVVTDELGTTAVLRAADDIEGDDLAAAPVEQLTIVGHVDSVRGWVEDQPGSGVWRRS